MEITEYSDSTDPSELEYYYSPTAELEEQEEKTKREEQLRQEENLKVPRLDKDQIRERLKVLKDEFSTSFIKGKTLQREFK
jgi:hypothetical protein